MNKPSDYRQERDSMGEVLVPKKALFGAQTQRAVQNFPISGLLPGRAFIWSMALIITCIISNRLFARRNACKGSIGERPNYS